MISRSKHHRSTIACSIPPEVKTAVWERDKHRCVICGTPVDLYFANAHFIPRSQLGLGIEENIFTACQRCHDAYDKGLNRRMIAERLRCRFKRIYPGWDEKKLTYKKY